MDVKKREKKYDKLVRQMSPKSTLLKDMAMAFLIGGLICTIGQFVTFFIASMGLNKEDTGSLTSAVMIFFGALLTGLGVYDNIAYYGKAGTLVPITGFANSIVSAAVEYRTEGMILGVGAKMFTIAGPVLVYGISASVIYGIIYFIGGLL